MGVLMRLIVIPIATNTKKVFLLIALIRSKAVSVWPFRPNGSSHLDTWQDKGSGLCNVVKEFTLNRCAAFSGTDDDS
jgi:hypothetical protein